MEEPEIYMSVNPHSPAVSALEVIFADVFLFHLLPPPTRPAPSSLCVVGGSSYSEAGRQCDGQLLAGFTNSGMRSIDPLGLVDIHNCFLKKKKTCRIRCLKYIDWLVIADGMQVFSLNGGSPPLKGIKCWPLPGCHNAHSQAFLFSAVRLHM